MTAISIRTAPKTWKRALSAAALAFAMPSIADDSIGGGGRYTVTELVGDQAGHGTVDPHLVNAWGIAFNPNGYVWVANADTGTSTLYDGNGAIVPLVVSIPGPGGAGQGSPTGIVFNGDASAFKVGEGGSQAAAAFLFATEEGLIAGWAPAVAPTNATVAVDNSAAGAIYKGLASAADGNRRLLYATDFHNGKIDVFDAAFNPVSLPAGAFVDRKVPTGFAPFGIQAINGDIYVTYAKQDANKEDDVPGKHLGYVSVFDAGGKLIRHLVSGQQLNAPWGMAMAPQGFGRFAGRLLIGNFGDGRINAFDAANGDFKGTLRAADGKALGIEGLWGLSFGNGLKGQSADALFFTAGPGDEAHGLYGRISAAP